MNRRNKNSISSKYILIALVIIGILFLLASYSFEYTGEPFRSISNYIFVPMQKGIDYVGELISISSDDSKTREELIAENEALEEQVQELQAQVTTLQLELTELETLQDLFDLDQQYEYEKVGARVIASDSSNWFNSFTINKGSSSGIEKGMNVIADSGLVGIVTDVGEDYAVVRAIIDDTTNVSGMVLSTNDNLIVSGSLEDMNSDNVILFSGLDDQDDEVSVGDAIVTSNISDQYQPGILIGYISTITEDTNKLTKSGTITPVVDFKHLQDVLVILELKDTGAEE